MGKKLRIDVAFDGETVFCQDETWKVIFKILFQVFLIDLEAYGLAIADVISTAGSVDDFEYLVLWDCEFIFGFADNDFL